MAAQFHELAALFDELAERIAALKQTHAQDACAATRLEAAELCAKRGADIARSRKPSDDEGGL